MDKARKRIQEELDSVMDRLRQLGGAVIVEEFPGSLDDDGPFADPADEVQAHGEQEVGLAARRLLVERANQLAEALERLRKSRLERQKT